MIRVEDTEVLQGCIEEVTLILREQMGRWMRDILQEAHGKDYGAVWCLQGHDRNLDCLQKQQP